MKPFDEKLTETPIIGIAVVMSDQEKMGKYCLPVSYVKNVEGSGARVVPIFPDKSKEYYRQMFTRINGLLIPGGAGTPLEYQEAVTEMVKLFYDWSIAAYDNDTLYFPIWGTCLGFEILATVTAGMTDCLESCHCRPGSKKLEMKSGYQDSRFFKSMPNDLVQALMKESILPHVHAFCVTLEDFYKFDLQKFYRLIGTNKDKHDMEYVTAMESYKYPIYAFLSHQEKALYQWNPGHQFSRSLSAIRLGQHMMNFFVQECCKNANRFPNVQQEHAAMIQNFTPKFTAPLGFIADECYYFS